LSINPLTIVAALVSGAIAVVIGVNVIHWEDETKPSATPITTNAPEKATVPNLENGKNKNNKTQRLPAFDVVSIGPDGNSVIVGRAVSGSTVIIMDGKKSIGKIIADNHGDWVFLTQSPLPAGNRKLSLKMILPNGESMLSNEPVFLIIPKKETDVSEINTKYSGAMALKIPSYGGPSTLLQSPGGPRPNGLNIETLDYGDTGSLIVSGRADAKALINIYLGDVFIGRATANEQGLWRISPEKIIEPGLYELRADQVDEKGKVIVRISMPFSKADPTTNMKSERNVIVQPGNSLWRLAYKAYGKGTQYTTIFLANKDQIKDPDLIYPGQVFAMPTSK